MKNNIKSIITYIVYVIVIIVIFGGLLLYSDYKSEKEAIKIFKEERLDTLSKKEAKYWVQFNVGNTNSVKYYLLKMINEGTVPDSITFWSNRKH